jgi:hypothetical protein
MIACPDCATASSVRAWAFDERFWGILALLATPLAILATVAALLYRLGLDSDSTYDRGRFES